MDLIMRSEVSQREKDKYVISLIGGILKNYTNEFIKKKKTETNSQT